VSLALDRPDSLAAQYPAAAYHVAGYDAESGKCANQLRFAEVRLGEFV